MQVGGLAGRADRPSPPDLTATRVGLHEHGRRLTGRNGVKVAWQSQSQRSGPSGAPKSNWPVYFGIIALLVLIVVALAGGIIWFNSRKSTELLFAAAERQMDETGAKISDRIALLYDPL